ncbi:hypothetical protein Trco_002017 [Trichoderma cornu-damae]|uniref:Uncharacterized protein n=1 Tax=Trichoderma cornu-damae TaxID=654480 RepID=A0A9P8QP19_9HYPO|nr:hypothetical protein Trco_002017 [Trichoderma cornu-damae]
MLGRPARPDRPVDAQRGGPRKGSQARGGCVEQRRERGRQPLQEPEPEKLVRRRAAGDRQVGRRAGGGGGGRGRRGGGVDEGQVRGDALDAQLDALGDVGVEGEQGALGEMGGAGEAVEGEDGGDEDVGEEQEEEVAEEREGGGAADEELRGERVEDEELGGCGGGGEVLGAEAVEEEEEQEGGELEGDGGGHGSQDYLRKVGRGGNLRSVAQGGKLVQRAVGDLAADLRAQDVKVAQLGGDLGGRPVGADGDLVLVADDEQRLGDDVAKVVGDGRGQHHVDDLALVLDELVALGAEVDVGQHGDPGGVRVVPLADVVDLLLVGLDRGKRLGGLGGDVVVEGDVGHALFHVVLQAHGVDQHQPVDGGGVLQGEARAQHAADGVADEGDAADAQRVEQAAGVHGQLVEAELPTWSGAMTRYPALARATMVAFHVGPQKFLPCSTTAVWPLGEHVGLTSMKAICSVCCWLRNVKTLTG